MGDQIAFGNNALGSTNTPALTNQRVGVPPTRHPRPGKGIRGNEGRAGWLFVAPSIVLLIIFLVVPILMALWTSLSDWGGKGSPLSANYTGLTNYAKILVDPGLTMQNMAAALRNNVYYVILVVPLQTALALLLASILNGRRLRGKSFFRSAFYFPSVSSSVAIMSVFLFMFTSTGAVNQVLSWLSIRGPNWLNDSRGVLRLILSGLGVTSAPGWLANNHFLGMSWWDWLSGPSIAMCVLIILAIWTTGGTFMLMFLAAMQDIPEDVYEAADVDGATRWQIFRSVTLPALRPTMLLVVTLGLIGTWQVFDQVYLLPTPGAPLNTTLTPAYLSYASAFNNFQYGQASAIAFVLFAIIIVMNLIQRGVTRERKSLPRRRRFTMPVSVARQKMRANP